MAEFITLRRSDRLFCSTNSCLSTPHINESADADDRTWFMYIKEERNDVPGNSPLLLFRDLITVHETDD